MVKMLKKRMKIGYKNETNVCSGGSELLTINRIGSECEKAKVNLENTILLAVCTHYDWKNHVCVCGKGVNPGNC